MLDSDFLMLMLSAPLLRWPTWPAGLVLVRARGVERYLRYFVALGAGFLMATALLEMTPESLRLSPTPGRF